MARAYSNDLRIRVVQAVQNREGSQREIARRFNVSLSFVRDLLRRVRETGSVEPKPHSGRPAPKLSTSQLQVVRQLVISTNDATLDELSDRLHQQTLLKVSRSTV